MVRLPARTSKLVGPDCRHAVGLGEVREIVGLVPAAGQATRLDPLPCSKEIYPIGHGDWGGSGRERPRVACEYLLEKMRTAGARKVYVIIRRGKWDIPAFLGDGYELDLRLAYLLMRLPHGAPYSLDQAYPFVRDARVVFGFPDILFRCSGGFAKLLKCQETARADVALGIFPARNPEKMDMVELDSEGGVQSIVIKPPRTRLRYTWIIATWGPTFTEFMHDYLERDLARLDDGAPSADGEVHVGHVIEGALGSGLRVATELFSDGSYIDIGTPDDLAEAVTRGDEWAI